MTVEVAEVSLISDLEFAALALPDVAPDVPSIEPAVQPPTADDAAPEIAPGSDAAPDKPAPAVVEQPTPEALPEQPDMNFAPTELLDDVPVLPEPPSDGFQVPVETATDDAPKPLEAPRIAPLPAAEAPPDAEISETAAPEVVPDAAAETPAEEQSATAPEEATTEIVTEAETPANSAMASSARPISRPPRPAPPEPEPQNDAIAEALAAAVAEPTAPERAAPSGPPLTSGEKENLRVAVSQCWNVGSLSSEALRTTVVVAISLSRDGKPQKGSIRRLSYEGGSEAAADQAYEAARRAVIRCGAKGFNLPSDKYSQWQDIEITFNPEKMRFK